MLAEPPVPPVAARPPADPPVFAGGVLDPPVDEGELAPALPPVPGGGFELCAPLVAPEQPVATVRADAVTTRYSTFTALERLFIIVDSFGYATSTLANLPNQVS